MKVFVEPVIKVEKFELVDVITTSGSEDWGGGMMPIDDSL